MPAVTRISVAPVKGLGLVHPESVSLEGHGVRENGGFTSSTRTGGGSTSCAAACWFRSGPITEPGRVSIGDGVDVVELSLFGQTT
jgi:hypothetical protein